MLPLLFSLVPSIAAYSQCDPANYPYAGQKVVDIPFYTPGPVSVNINNSTVEVFVSGSMSIIDGCTFVTNNLSFNGPSYVKFVGKKSTDSFGTNAVLVTTSVATQASSPSSQTYKLVSSAGNWVSYNDFDMVELFDPASGAVIGIATLPAKGSTPISITSTRAAVLVSTTAAAAGAAPVATTAATSISSGASTMVLGGLSAWLLLVNAF
ncbi:hypothetical protein HDV01_007503 [Terramyces sp. JEL0728]|nr:hypothetical protein HDV01_007503 [Terramyces sp. JEL0728]